MNFRKKIINYIENFLKNNFVPLYQVQCTSIKGREKVKVKWGYPSLGHKRSRSKLGHKKVAFCLCAQIEWRSLIPMMTVIQVMTHILYNTIMIEDFCQINDKKLICRLIYMSVIIYMSVLIYYSKFTPRQCMTYTVCSRIRPYAYVYSK